MLRGKRDFALHNGKQCMIFVEVKKPSVDIDDHEDQLRDYCHQHPVDLAVLTNGLVWRLFQPTYGMGETLSFKQKRFNEIDLTVRKPSEYNDNCKHISTRRKWLTVAAPPPLKRSLMSAYKGKQ